MKLGCVAVAGCALVAMIAGSTAGAQTPSTPSAIVLVVDISGSMAEDDGTGRIKIDGAKVALLDFLQGVEPGTPIGLRTYPDQAGESCNRGRLAFAIAPRDARSMSAHVRTLQPDGDTPTAEALRAAADDLRASGAATGTIVVVSDGESTCDSPCDAAKEISSRGIDLQAITIGFRISDQGRKELECIANALDGEYLDVDDSKGLSDVLKRTSQSALTVKIDKPDRTVVAEVGDSPGGRVVINATVTNTSDRDSRDVVTRLRFDQNGPGVSQPTRRLGNIAPGEQRAVSWTFRPSTLLSNKTIELAVLAQGSGDRRPASATARIHVADAYSRADAGPILKNAKTLAILGDSYSAGEGGENYVSDTDSDSNSCHRSLATYLAREFEIPAERILACSGAVTAQVAGPDDKNKLLSQTDQLFGLYKAYPAKIDAVALTMGGNDAGFPDLAKSCIAGPKACDATIYTGLPNPFVSEPRDQFVTAHLSNDALPNGLVDAYKAINAVLNHRDAVAKRGRDAPILVLAYPLPVPLTGRTCAPMLNQLSAGELKFVVDFATRLNGIIEGAVIKARRDGVPVFFVPNTENAFLPDHTVCDGDPYARALNSVNGAGITPSVLLKFLTGNYLIKALAGKRVFERSTQELVHPNAKGYSVETNALIRWSLSSEGQAAEKFVRDAGAAPQSDLSWDISKVNLGQIDPGSTPRLQGGEIYPVTLNGFAANSTLRVEIRSAPRELGQLKADRDGHVQGRIAIPHDVAGGDHTIVFRGIDPQNRPKQVNVSISVAGGTWLTVPIGLLLVSVVAGAVAGLLTVTRRHWPSLPSRVSQR